MQTMIVAFTAAATVLSAPIFAHADESGTVKGRLIVGDKVMPLAFVYANANEDFGAGQDGEPEKSVTLLLSAEKVSDAERQNQSALEKRAREGKLHAIELRYDPETKKVYRGAIFCKTERTPNTPLHILFNNNANYRFDNFSLKSGIASGEAQMVEPGDWLVADAENAKEKSPVKYTYSFSFTTPVVLPAPITADLTGKAAEQSPQAKLGLQFFQAIQKDDFATVRKISLSSFKEDGTAEEQKVAHQFARALSPSPKEFTRMSKRVIVRGETATLIAGSPAPNNRPVTLKMVRQRGKWVISE